MVNNERLTQIRGTGPVRRLEIDILLSASIQAVWNAITLDELMQQWWTGGEVEVKDEGRIVLEDGAAVNGTVKCCRPPYVFEFTWNDNPDSAAHPHLIDVHTNSLLRFDLIEEDDGTALTFTQYLPPREIAAAAAGWHQIIGERLKSFVETGQVPDNHEARFNELMKLYKT